MFGLSNKGLDFKTLDECDKNDPLLEAWKGQYGKGVFGHLSLQENTHAVFYDEMVNQDDSRNRLVEESCGIIESMVGRLIEQKKVIEASSLMCIEMHLNDDKMKEVIKKVVKNFNGTTLKALIGGGHEDRMDVDVMNVHATEGEKSDEEMNKMLTDLTKKTGKDLPSGSKVYSVLNVDATTNSDLGMERISLTILKPTGMCNDKVMVKQQGGSHKQNMGMEVVVNNGNSSFDSLCIVTPVWIKQADEIERNISKKSIKFKNDGPSFEARLDECAYEMNTLKGNEGKDDAVVEQECNIMTKRNVRAIVGISINEAWTFIEVTFCTKSC
ncbi:unnamed protein product [Lactuca saligna]|uniref:Uncharacterized protein n=1 Tax=Lactuca saligna TaxID=75948 RepID=A0AA36EJ40_LACSI|nr:unnamed protein product [Lactuca saligna]